MCAIPNAALSYIELSLRRFPNEASSRVELHMLPPPVPIRLTTLPSHDCNYLPGRLATARAFRADNIPEDLYHDFMNAGFRRSGKIIYQPACESCQLCVPIRVVVDQFTPSKSQRRCFTKNKDLTVGFGPPTPTQEKFDLYQKYQTQWHQKVADPGEDPWAAFISFLYDSPVNTLEFTYRTAANQLVALGIADVSPRSLSSVYFYFDPSFCDRGLGTFGAICELDWARCHKIPHYYLGFWVHGCSKMMYKTGFRPYQLLNPDGKWYDK